MLIRHGVSGWPLICKSTGSGFRQRALSRLARATLTRIYGLPSRISMTDWKRREGMDWIVAGTGPGKNSPENSAEGLKWATVMLQLYMHRQQKPVGSARWHFDFNLCEPRASA